MVDLIIFEFCEMADFVKRGSVQFVKHGSCQLKLAAQEVRGSLILINFISHHVRFNFISCGQTLNNLAMQIDL